MGISVRKLLGWEPAEVTTFEHDEAGRVVKTVTVRESEFSDLDRRWLLASHEAAHQSRGPHGVLMSEATDPANMGKFTVPPPTVDLAEWALINARLEAEKVYKDKIPLGALRFKVEKD